MLPPFALPRSRKLSAAARTYLLERLNMLDESGQRGVLPPLPPPPPRAQLLVVLPPRPPSPSSSCRGSSFAASRARRKTRRELAARSMCSSGPRALGSSRRPPPHSHTGEAGEVRADARCSSRQARKCRRAARGSARRRGAAAAKKPPSASGWSRPRSSSPRGQRQRAAGREPLSRGSCSCGASLRILPGSHAALLPGLSAPPDGNPAPVFRDAREDQESGKPLPHQKEARSLALCPALLSWLTSLSVVVMMLPRWVMKGLQAINQAQRAPRTPQFNPELQMFSSII
ncbi:espin-like [Python bivittatus]|uniref:Espin-like n=1 Tax=Python bivittatus TaxID=176946 RepID=A0A9F5J9G7_PYTBI|nr:espin-like [Python bivittatus]